MVSKTVASIPTGGSEISARLRAVREEIQLIQLASFTSLEPAEAARVAQEVEVTTRGFEALTNKVVVGLEAGGAWAASGARNFARWLTAKTHRKASTTRTQVKTARTLRDELPLTAEAHTGGQISGEHVQLLTTKATKTEALRQQLTDPEMGEGFLVEQATRLPVEAFAKVVAAWALRTDPEAADRAWREKDAAEELFLSPTMDGYALNGWLSTEHGQVLDEALRAITGVPAATDDRHPSGRRADALTHLARMALDSGELQPSARSRPHIAVTITHPTLEALIAANHPGGDRTGQERSGDNNEPFGPESGGGEAIPACMDHAMLHTVAPPLWPDGSPIPPAQAAKLLCDGEFHRVVFDGEGQILDSGRTRRLFTPAQTRAAIARDGHCQFPDCTAPPEQGEIHHSIWWYHHGRTSIDNAILLCWYHHDYVHQHSISITSTGQGWVFRTPDGLPITSTPAPAALAAWTDGSPNSVPGAFTSVNDRADWTAHAQPAQGQAPHELPDRAPPGPPPRPPVPPLRE